MSPLQECPHCPFVTLPSHQNCSELCCLCLISQNCRIPNGLQGCVNPLTLTERPVMVPGLQLSCDETSGLSCQIELWAGTSHMGRRGWLCALSASCWDRIYSSACCSSCWLSLWDGERGKAQLTALVSTAVLIFFIC